MPEILAVALTVSQVFTKPPEQFQAKFDPVADRAQIVAILSDGCKLVSKDLNFSTETTADGEEDLVEAMLKQATKRAKTLQKKWAAEASATLETPATGEAPVTAKKTMTQKVIEKLDFESLTLIYKTFCKGQQTDPAALRLEEGIAKFNDTMKDLPDHTKLKGLQLPGATTILDRNGERFTEVFAENGRRTFVPLAQLPSYVGEAFMAAEDQDFMKHHGLDLHGVIRAFKSLFEKNRPQGGSTITQQVVKNLLVGDSVSPERKMREMVIASRVEKLLSKQEILELYVNYVFLGRASWGVEMAAKSYFGKSARDLTRIEAAFLAGLTKGPNAFSPDRVPEQAKQRLQYVVGRMKDDKYIKDEDLTKGEQTFIEGKDPMPVIKFESPRQRAAYYFLDEIQRDVKAKTGIASLTSGSYVVRSTIHPELQKAAELALQNGLMDYEKASGRAKFNGPAGSIAKQMAEGNSTWQELMASARGAYWDIRLPLAVMLGSRLQTPDGKVFTTKNPMIGLQDGRVISLIADTRSKNMLSVYDLVHVKLNEDGKSAKLISPPRVQGAIVVMEAKTGRVLAMSGGFSYAASQLNRVTQSLRQPGSTLKPFIYLSALNLGLQPNTLIPNAPLSLPPIERGAQWWSPKNFDGGGRGLVTFRYAVEKSLNLPTARIMAAIGQTPTEGLDYIRGITHELGIYDNPLRVYPFVLGAQPTRLIDMAVAYATVANVTAPYSSECPMCLKPVPHFIDSVSQGGKLIWKRDRANGLQPVNSLDRVSLYQIRRILQGTIERGTAIAAKKDLGGFVAGKTGTSNNTIDAWFVGFTNDLVVGVWMGYDSRDVASGLGGAYTGGRVALPIAKEMFLNSFELYKEKEPLDGIPADLQSQVIEYPIDVRTGDFARGGQFMEVFRMGPNRGPLNTQRRILKRAEYGMMITEPLGEEDDGYGVQTLYDNEQIQGDPRIFANPTGYQNYMPGFEDPRERYFQQQPFSSDYYQ
ncbi:MAG: transglycosylase domain-containing protein [Bdellovibrionales bacterium]|nr:transglycosylase domain-containing protein [Bdellovibrionales bacterium]